MEFSDFSLDALLIHTKKSQLTFDLLNISPMLSPSYVVIVMFYISGE